MEYVNKALMDWIPRLSAKEMSSSPQTERRCTPGQSGNKDKMKTQVPLLYIKGLLEEFCRTFSVLGIATYFKPKNTLQQLLIAPKDPSKKEEKFGVVSD